MQDPERRARLIAAEQRAMTLFDRVEELRTSLDGNGRWKHWILEIHLVDKAKTFGGFYERLL
jgi:hypothetical protein